MRKRVRNSVIWKISEEDFKNLVETSKTMSQVLSFFQMENKGNNYKTCKARIKEMGLNTEHFLNCRESSINTRRVTREIFITRLCEDSHYINNHIKEGLIKFNLKEYKCEKCNLGDVWQNEYISLQLEHKNGKSNDNRLENLCFLCPNCHSQTDTFAGKRHKKRYLCVACNKAICRSTGKGKNKLCAICAAKQSRKYERPVKEKLEELIKTIPMENIPKELNLKCSGNAIKKWCKEYNIDYKNLSPYSRKNRIKKERVRIKTFASKYKYVSLDNVRQQWAFSVKEKRKIIHFKRYDTEIQAAEAAAKYFNKTELILR